MLPAPTNQSELYPGSHSILSESLNSPISAVEQARRDVEDELIALFIDEESPQTFRFYDVAELLHSARKPLVYAMEEMELLPPKPHGYEWTNQRVQDQVKEISHRDIIKLNNHRFTRTLSTTELTKALNTEGKLTEKDVTEKAAELNIIPVKTWNIAAHGRQSYKGYFDLDQVELLRRALSGETVPKQENSDESVKKRATQHKSEDTAQAEVQASDTSGLYAARVLMAQFDMTADELEVFSEIVQAEPAYLPVDDTEELQAFYNESQTAEIVSAKMRNIARKRNN